MEPLIRIALYMIGSYLVGIELITEEFVRDIVHDPRLVGEIVLAISGVWYALAKWKGWRT